MTNKGKIYRRCEKQEVADLMAIDDIDEAIKKSYEITESTEITGFVFKMSGSAIRVRLNAAGVDLGSKGGDHRKSKAGLEKLLEAYPKIKAARADLVKYLGAE